MLSAFGSILAGLVVVIGPFGRDFGFGVLPPTYFAVLVLMVVTYLALVQLFKRRFYRVSGWQATE